MTGRWPGARLALPHRIPEGPSVDAPSPAPPSSRTATSTFRMARLVLSVLIAVSLTAACAVRETGRPAPASPDRAATGQITYDELTAGHADAFARVRTIDMCAVHDVAAAERITGTTAGSLRLSTGLATCDPETGTEDPPSRWRFELGFGSRLTTDWTTVELAGADVRKKPGDTGGCEYLVPVTDAAGLTVGVSYARAAGQPPRRSAAPLASTHTGEAYLDCLGERQGIPEQDSDMQRPNHPGSPDRTPKLKTTLDLSSSPPRT